jgi:predicted nucleic acid-binding Zn ribbon protein
MSAYELKRKLAGIEYGTRDAKLRCMQCGKFSAGSPMCDECAEAVMKVVERRRHRMQVTFYYILILAIVAYYVVL